MPPIATSAECARPKLRMSVTTTDAASRAAIESTSQSSFHRPWLRRTSETRTQPGAARGCALRVQSTATNARSAFAAAVESDKPAATANASATT